MVRTTDNSIRPRNKRQRLQLVKIIHFYIIVRLALCACLCLRSVGVANEDPLKLKMEQL